MDRDVAKHISAYPEAPCQLLPMVRLLEGGCKAKGVGGGEGSFLSCLPLFPMSITPAMLLHPS